MSLLDAVRRDGLASERRPMPILAFIRENARWIAGGFLLTLFSAAGQTYFISLSAGDIRAEYGLSHGQFGLLYMIATLASALTLTRLGQIVDWLKVGRVTLVIVPALAAASVAMALSGNIVLLTLAIYLLRLFGQGMMTHTAMTAMGRWFSAQRGRAISLVALGQNAGEALVPSLFVATAGAIGWRGAWGAAAALLVAVALPAIFLLMRVERTPRADDPAIRADTGRDWTRAEVVRDPVFYLLLLGVLAPSFIGTTIFFHQIYLVELRGWTMEFFASTFALMAGATIVCALVCGALIDRFSAVRMLPFFLLPLAAACLVLASFEGRWSAWAFMLLQGMSYGFASTLFGALWPEIYGTRHLGSVRSLVMAAGVFASAAGPGLTGYLIDRGVGYPDQILAMGVYSLAGASLLLLASRIIRRRTGAAGSFIQGAGATD
ncbi:MFS transporter [Amaricoccus sp.]|uniref:MFS transporter n=1 Tax=Amaricoccus sp. TaxID=1872485 RepID=UPI0026370CEB|nr:MFS transporter [uncultured Amaricoccus sp.]